MKQLICILLLIALFAACKKSGPRNGQPAVIPKVKKTGTSMIHTYDETGRSIKVIDLNSTYNITRTYSPGSLTEVITDPGGAKTTFLIALNNAGLTTNRRRDTDAPTGGMNYDYEGQARLIKRSTANSTPNYSTVVAYYYSAQGLLDSTRVTNQDGWQETVAYSDYITGKPYTLDNKNFGILYEPDLFLYPPGKKTVRTPGNTYTNTFRYEFDSKNRIVTVYTSLNGGPEGAETYEYTD